MRSWSNLTFFSTDSFVRLPLNSILFKCRDLRNGSITPGELFMFRKVPLCADNLLLLSSNRAADSGSNNSTSVSVLIEEIELRD